MREFIDPEWLVLLRHNKLDNFDALWSLEAEWFEPVNRRRDGWSGVSRVVLHAPDGVAVGIFLKRQQNHFCKSVLPGVQGMPTFEREFRAMRRAGRYGSVTPCPVYFGKRKSEGKQQAVFITAELQGFRSMDDYFSEWAVRGQWPGLAKRVRFSRAVAQAMRQLHLSGIEHRGTHMKHIYVREKDGALDVRFLDFEKSHRVVIPWRAFMVDFSGLHRRENQIWHSRVKLTESVRFANHYYGSTRLGRYQRWVLRQTLQRIRNRAERTTEIP